MQTPRRYMGTSRVPLISRTYSLCLMLPLMSNSRTTQRTVASSEGQGSWQDGPLPTLLPTTPQEDYDRRPCSLPVSLSFLFQLFSVLNSPVPSLTSRLGGKEGFPVWCSPLSEVPPMVIAPPPWASVLVFWLLLCSGVIEVEHIFLQDLCLEQY